ncbi:MAG: class I SAM-dependent methyltransferase [Gemmatimonadetes bacterium]|nr:class I SAM-dependent methyltransferase [Gemmatimonadota bacterium]
MAHSVRRHLDLEITAYDTAIRQFIRGYDSMIAEAAAAVAAVSPGHVIDLGAGTGALSEALLAHASVGTVELLDVDQEMLGQARIRLGGTNERVRFTAGSYFEPLPPCDAVCASLSLHHIPSLSEKQALYQRIRSALRPGGVFVNADVMIPSEGPEKDAEYRAWVHHNVEQGIPEPQVWANFESWAEEDTYYPVETELALLEEAGFQASCPWRAAPSTVVVAHCG